MICLLTSFFFAFEMRDGVRYTAGVCAYACPSEVEEIKYTFALIPPHLGEAGCAPEIPHHYIKEARGSAGAAPLRARAELESESAPQKSDKTDDPHDPMWYE